MTVWAVGGRVEVRAWCTSSRWGKGVKLVYCSSLSFVVCQIHLSFLSSTSSVLFSPFLLEMTLNDSEELMCHYKKNSTK